MKFRLTIPVLVLALSLLVLPAVAADGDLARVVTSGDTIDWQPYGPGAFTLVVTGPNGFHFRESFRSGDVPSLAIFDRSGERLADGQYRYELRPVVQLSAAQRRDVRGSGNARGLDDNARVEGQYGYFRIHQGAIVRATGEEQESVAAPAPQGGLQNMPAADQVILDDLIVDGSACIGQDCVNGESFGFDTLRLKENNLRIKAQDTSNSASFPSNDWQITFNDSGNGGANKFSIDDIDGGRTPFTIEASAPSNSLYVDDGGRIGLGTATPVVEVHIVDGDTPTIRLEQDGSSGFQAQTWDLAGNETNFFVRDVSNGSKLPFKVLPNAPTNSLVLEGSTGDLGVGTASPSGAVHIVRTAAGSLDAVKITNNGGSFITFENTNSNDDWFLTSQNLNEGSFIIDSTVEGAADGAEFTLDVNGNLTLAGTLTIVGGCTGCDAVFQPGFELESIEEHAAFMWENSYLPGVGPTPEGKTQINVFEKTTGMLQELEKAHIYIDQLNGQLKSQTQLIEELQKRLEALEQ